MTLERSAESIAATDSIGGVLLHSLLAVLAGADGFTDIARFGDSNIDLLRRFRPFIEGTPPHDTLGDIYAWLDHDIKP